MEDAWCLQVQQNVARLVSFLPKAEAGLVRTMDKTMQGTWMAKKRKHDPMIQVRRFKEQEERGAAGRRV